jgi:reactive intermediate/imine deaminase
MDFISTPNAPTAAGHYSQAVVHNGFVFVAGQLGGDPARPGVVPPTIEEQTENALKNVSAILAAAGSSLDRVVQMTVYVSDIALWSQVNATYAKIMGSHKPARAIVPVSPLHHGFLIEIAAIAAAE